MSHAPWPFVAQPHEVGKGPMNPPPQEPESLICPYTTFLLEGAMNLEWWPCGWVHIPHISRTFVVNTMSNAFVLFFWITISKHHGVDTQSLNGLRFIGNNVILRCVCFFGVAISFTLRNRGTTTNIFSCKSLWVKIYLQTIIIALIHLYNKHNNTKSFALCCYGIKHPKIVWNVDEVAWGGSTSSPIFNHLPRV